MDAVYWRGPLLHATEPRDAQRGRLAVPGRRAPFAPPVAAKRRRFPRLDQDGRPAIAPTLVVVSGPPSSGKTTLAHRLAKAIPCPAISRDEIKEGMVHAHGDTFEPSAGDPLTRRTFSVFFEILRVLLEEDVTVVAEAAFQDPLWREGLKLTDLADLRIIRCNVEPATAHRRYRDRGERGAHASIIGAESKTGYGSTNPSLIFRSPSRRSTSTRRTATRRASMRSSSS